MGGNCPLPLTCPTPCPTPILAGPCICPIEFSDIDPSDAPPSRPHNNQPQTIGTADRFVIRGFGPDDHPPNTRIPTANQQPAYALSDQQQSTTNKQQQPHNHNNPSTDGKIVIVSQNNHTLAQYYNPNPKQLATITIPCNVIKLSLSDTLTAAISKYNPSFYDKYTQQAAVRAGNWRMLATGVYVNLLENIHGVFIGRGMFYEGYYMRRGEVEYVPDVKGVYIDGGYVYQGELKMGRPWGRGKLVDRGQGEVFEGEWGEGGLVKGSFEGRGLRFKGEFYNSVPSGYGELQISKIGVVYKGLFREGVFYDQNGQYQCKKYSYVGGFVAGRKNGEGKLYDKLKKATYKGKWQDDKLCRQPSSPSSNK